MFVNRRRHNPRRYPILSFPEKANRILNILLIAFLLILIRVWHLSIIQYDKKSEEARRPRNEVMEPAMRGTIRDRFNIPLAINKIGYQASIYYSHLKDIPTIVLDVDLVSGKRTKR